MPIAQNFFKYTFVGCFSTSQSSLHPKGRYERHPPCRRFGHAPVSQHARHFQAALARVRQAHDLLSAVRADAGGHPRHPGRYHARRPAHLPPFAGRRQRFRHPPALCRAAAARRIGASAADCRTVYQRRPDLPGAGRQYLLRTVVYANAATGGGANARRNRIRLSRAKSRTLRRGGAGRRFPRRRH